MSFLDRDEGSGVCKGGCDSRLSLLATLSAYAAHAEVVPFLVVIAGRAPRGKLSRCNPLVLSRRDTHGQHVTLLVSCFAWGNSGCIRREGEGEEVEGTS